MRHLAVITTVADLAEARAIARAMVERGLAACAHVSPVESFYRWEGRLQNEPEYQLALKTTEERCAALEAAIKAVHPYELPDIHAVELKLVHAPYARWLEDNCGGEQVSGR